MCFLDASLLKTVHSTVTMAPRYTRNELMHIFNTSAFSSVPKQVFSNLKCHGICAKPTHRGTTAGSKHQRPISTRVINWDRRQPVPCSVNNHHTQEVHLVNPKSAVNSTVNHNNLVPLKTHNQTSKNIEPLKLCHLNHWDNLLLSLNWKV